MGKKRIGVDNLDTAICPASGKVYADGSIILTSGALDELENAASPLSTAPSPKPWRPAPDSAGGLSARLHVSGLPRGPTRGVGDLESLVLAVAGAIKADCHISDPEQLKTVSCQAIATIRTPCTTDNIWRACS